MRPSLSVIRALTMIPLVTVLVVSCKGSGVTVQEVKGQIEKELPLGSPSSQVTAFLDSRGISHSDYVEGELYSVEKSEFVETRLINASISKVERRLWVDYDIYITFWFDENRRLVDYEAVKRRRDT